MKHAPPLLVGLHVLEPLLVVGVDVDGHVPGGVGFRVPDGRHLGVHRRQPRRHRDLVRRRRRVWKETRVRSAHQIQVDFLKQVLFNSRTFQLMSGVDMFVD